MVADQPREGRRADRGWGDAAGRAWPRSRPPKPTAAGRPPTRASAPPRSPPTCSGSSTPTLRPRLLRRARQQQPLRDHLPAERRQKAGDAGAAAAQIRRDAGARRKDPSLIRPPRPWVSWPNGSSDWVAERGAGHHRGAAGRVGAAGGGAGVLQPRHDRSHRLRQLRTDALARRRRGGDREDRALHHVLLGPLRVNAAILAKQALTLQALSGGRFTLGVALGGREDDYEISHVEMRVAAPGSTRRSGRSRRFGAAARSDRTRPASPGC